VLRLGLTYLNLFIGINTCGVVYESLWKQPVIFCKLFLAYFRTLSRTAYENNLQII